MLDTILISGGSRGIGAAMVSAFAKEGYRVAFTYLNSSNTAKTLANQTGAVAIHADMSDYSDIIRAYNIAYDSLCGIDVVINNVGVSQIALMSDITRKNYSDLMKTNLDSAFFLTQAALPTMISKKRGRVINISSVWGVVGASCEVHYSASKAGLIGFTRALAKEVAPSQITVNCIAPGVIDTDMNAVLSDSEREQTRCEIPIGRLGHADEIAALALFLASDRANYITGQVIGVDGGYGL